MDQLLLVRCYVDVLDGHHGADYTVSLPGHEDRMVCKPHLGEVIAYLLATYPAACIHTTVIEVQP